MHVSVRVPASTSNLGAGFDCVGIAVDRWLRVTVGRGPDARAPLRIERRGTVRDVRVPAERDLLVSGFAAACRAAGQPVPGSLAFRADSSIPVGRGLGASAAALVAGAVAANALLELGLADDAIIALTAAVEGHPDNVAAAVRGGATLAAPRASGGYSVARLAVHRSLALVLAVPPFTVATERARAALPAVLPHPTAASAVARAAALVAGLASGDRSLLAAGLDDVLHVPFRRGLIPGYEAVVAAAVAAGAAGATLSGSGSSIVAVAAAGQAATVADAMTTAWREWGVSAEAFSGFADVGGYATQVLSPLEV